MPQPASPMPRPMRRLVAAAAAVSAIGIGAAVVTALPARAAGSIVVDRTDDVAAANGCTAAGADCSLRGALVFADAQPGTTVVVPAGTYDLSHGELQVGSATNTSTTIIGAGAAITTIHQTVANTRVLDVNPSAAPNVSLSLSGVTLSGGQGTTYGGGAILAGGSGNTLTIDDVVFLGNASQPLANNGGGYNGGAISFAPAGTLTVTNSTFSSNTAAGNGGAIWANLAGPGAGSVSVSSTTFTANQSSGTGTTGGQGGALWLGGLAADTFSVTGSTFTANTASGAAGGGAAIYTGTGAFTLTGNRVVGNTPAARAVYAESGSVNATRAWWGCNAGPGNAGCDGTATTAGATVVSAPRLQLTLTALPATVDVNQPSALTASFLVDSAAAAVPVGQLGAVLGVPITFPSPVLGTISGADTTVQASGTATATFDAGATGGIGSAAAHVDSQTTTASIEVDAPPAVTTNPSDQTVNAGATASFSSAASGFPAPTVQWQVSTDGGATFANVGGATGTTLSFTAAVGDDDKQYRAVFTNSAGSATSTAATLTVQSGPTVTTNPSDQTVDAGQPASFTAAASGNPSPAVQWQVSTNGGATFTNVAGATSTTLSFTAVAGDNGKQFQAVFTNSVGPATTTAATLTVQYAPTVTANPSDQTVNAGDTASFTAAASGNPAPTVQWQVSTNSGATFTNVAGATSTTLSFTAAAGDDGKQFRAVFTNSVGSATSAAATLSVQTGPTVTSNPSDQTVNAGQQASVSAAASGNPSPAVQWQVSTNGGTTFTNVAGATSTTLSFTAAAGDDGKQFRAVFTNSVASATTTAATLTVRVAPVVTANPSAVTVNAGQQASFSAAASGSPTPTVQWQVSTDGGATFADVAGATSTTLSFTAVAGDNGKQYSAVFTNAAGSATSTAATLTVQTGPVVTTNPTNQTVNAGQQASFSAAASGNPSPTVQWQVSTNGVTFTDVAGATSTTLSFTAVAGDNAKQYRALFTNPAGSATTTAATLTVQTAPVVITNPSNAAAVAGATVSFTAAASGIPTPTVRWEVSADGGATFTAVVGATSTTLSFTTVGGDNGKRYRAVFTNAVASATTTSATLTVDTLPLVATQPQDVTTAPGKLVTFTAAAGGQPAPTVQWQVSTNGTTFSDITGATSTSYTVRATPPTTGSRYRAVFTNRAGSTPSTSATLTVSPPRKGTLKIAPSTVQRGGTVTVTGDGLEPGETVTVQLFSSPVTVATLTAGPTGALDAVVSIPLSTAPGAHTLVATGAFSGTALQGALTVGSGLPPTGSDPAPPVVLGVLLLFVGGVLLLAGRRPLRTLPVRRSNRRP